MGPSMIVTYLYASSSRRANFVALRRNEIRLFRAPFVRLRRNRRLLRPWGLPPASGFAPGDLTDSAGHSYELMRGGGCHPRRPRGPLPSDSMSQRERSGADARPASKVDDRCAAPGRACDDSERPTMPPGSRSSPAIRPSLAVSASRRPRKVAGAAPKPPAGHVRTVAAV